MQSVTSVLCFSFLLFQIKLALLFSVFLLFADLLFLGSHLLTLHLQRLL